MMPLSKTNELNLIMVVFPQPVGPMMPRLSPRRMAKLMSDRHFSRSAPANEPAESVSP